MIDPCGFEAAGPVLDAVNHVALLQQELHELTAVLACDTGDQDNFGEVSWGGRHKYCSSPNRAQEFLLEVTTVGRRTQSSRQCSGISNHDMELHLLGDESDVAPGSRSTVNESPHPAKLGRGLHHETNPPHS